jgi:hypothetical protein
MRNRVKPYPPVPPEARKSSKKGHTPSVATMEGAVATNAVKRCIAIAAHGRRCQQTPHRGGPYCWHHLQSRKVYAPSRPPSAPRAEAEGRRGAEPSAAVKRSGPLAETAAASGARLARALGTRRVAVLMGFLEGKADGSYVLSRDRGVLDEGETVRTERYPPASLTPD